MLTEKKVLVVEDSPTTARLIRSLLYSAGYYYVTTAVDGLDALARLEEQPADCVLADWNMPRMDGLALVRHLKADKKYSDIPIIIVTTRSSAEDVAQILQAGADDYLVKPFVARELVEKIEHLVAAQKPEDQTL